MGYPPSCRLQATTLRINREVSLRYQYRQCRETGRIDAFKLQWRPGSEEAPYYCWDSDVAKWIEAASYSLAAHSDAEPASQVEEVIGLVASAQQPDGFLNTRLQSRPDPPRCGRCARKIRMPPRSILGRVVENDKFLDASHMDPKVLCFIIGGHITSSQTFPADDIF